MAEWFENETFWEGLYPFIFPSERLEAAAEEIDNVLDLVALEGGRVLDLCCGPGRHSVALARRGFDVTGVDRSRYLLEKAGEPAAGSGVEVEWIEADMRRFSRPDSFDLVISLYTSFGYFENRDNDNHVLEGIYQNLAPGGVVVFDLMGKERLARIFQPTSSREGPDGALLVERHKIVDDWTRAREEWILIKEESAKTFKFLLNLYCGHDIREMLERAGFTHIYLHGDLTGSPYDTDATRLVAVARKD